MKTPETNTTWTKQALRAKDHERLDLFGKRPVVAWFSKDKRAVRHLVKVTARLGDDLWIIHGWGYEHDGDGISTLSPGPFDITMRYLTVENGWVLCEFPNEETFYEAALEYLRQ